MLDGLDIDPIDTEKVILQDTKSFKCDNIHNFSYCYMKVHTKFHLPAMCHTAVHYS